MPQMTTLREKEAKKKKKREFWKAKCQNVENHCGNKNKSLKNKINQ